MLSIVLSLNLVESYLLRAIGHWLILGFKSSIGSKLDLSDISLEGNGVKTIPGPSAPSHMTPTEAEANRRHRTLSEKEFVFLYK